MPASIAAVGKANTHRGVFQRVYNNLSPYSDTTLHKFRESTGPQPGILCRSCLQNGRWSAHHLSQFKHQTAKAIDCQKTVSEIQQKQAKYSTSAA